MRSWIVLAVAAGAIINFSLYSVWWLILLSVLSAITAFALLMLYRVSDSYSQREVIFGKIASKSIAGESILFNGAKTVESIFRKLSYNFISAINFKHIIMLIIALNIGGWWSQFYSVFLIDKPSAPITATSAYVSAEVFEVRGRYGKPGGQIGLKIIGVESSFDEKINLPNGTKIRAFWGGDIQKWKQAHKVKVRIKINPLPLPVISGDYHWGEKLLFENYDAVGFITSHPSIIEYHKGIVGLISDLRKNTVEKVYRLIDQDASGIAKALVIGDRSGIDQENIANFRSAGLSHLLAISGLHIGWVSLIFFVLFRQILVLAGRLVFYAPLHKIAAVLAALATIIYASIAEPSIATQRATIMAIVAYCAILADRKVISLSVVHLAMIIVLISNPYSVLTAGFQLSFAATWALVWFFSNDYFYRATNWISEKIGYSSSYYEPFDTSDNQGRSKVIANSRPVVYWLWVSLLSIFVVNIIAGLVTAPIVAYQFGWLHPYGLLGNLLAIPILLLLVMPCLVALVILPDFLAAPFGIISSLGINAMREIATWVASLRGSNIDVSQFVATIESYKWSALIIFIGALVTVRIGYLPSARKTFIKAAGLTLVPFSIVGFLVFTSENSALSAQKNNLLAVISADGKTIIFRANQDANASNENTNRRHGEWILLGKKNKRLLKALETPYPQISHNLEIRPVSGNSKIYTDGLKPNTHPVYLCDELGCVINLSLSTKLGWDFNNGGILENCDKVSILIALYAPKKIKEEVCGDTIIVDNSLLKNRGSLMLFSKSGGDMRVLGAADKLRKW